MFSTLLMPFLDNLDVISIVVDYMPHTLEMYTEDILHEVRTLDFASKFKYMRHQFITFDVTQKEEESTIKFRIDTFNIMLTYEIYNILKHAPLNINGNAFVIAAMIEFLFSYGLIIVDKETYLDPVYLIESNHNRIFTISPIKVLLNIEEYFE
jgi:hypothetical protein